MDAQYGCTVWVHSMGAQYGCTVWVHSMGAQYGCTVWMHSMDAQILWVQEKCSVGWLTSPEFTKTTHADTNWSKLFCTPPQGGGGGFLHTFCITPRHAIPPGGRKTSYTSYNRLCALFCYTVCTRRVSGECIF